MVTATVRTPEEIATLKRNWRNDPTWDIETTEGFEAHRTELYIWRLEYELQIERDNHKRLKDALNVLLSVANFASSR